MNIEVTITNYRDANFLRLTECLVSEYVALYGEEAREYCPMEALPEIAAAVVLRYGSRPAASGAFRRLDASAAELMRIFVLPEFRRKGLASRIVTALEHEANRRGFTHMRLVTGADMPDALALYARLGYAQIESYGDNAGDDILVCMEKKLTQ